jgi:hypothetical protein
MTVFYKRSEATVVYVDQLLGWSLLAFFITILCRYSTSASFNVRIN